MFVSHAELGDVEDGRMPVNPPFTRPSISPTNLLSSMINMIFTTGHALKHDDIHAKRKYSCCPSDVISCIMWYSLRELGQGDVISLSCLQGLGKTPASAANPFCHMKNGSVWG